MFEITYVGAAFAGLVVVSCPPVFCRLFPFYLSYLAGVGHELRLPLTLPIDATERA